MHLQYRALTIHIMCMCVNAFTHYPISRISTSARYMTSAGENDAAQKLLEQAAKIRAELAELEGKTISQVEQEAQEEKKLRQLQTEKQEEEESARKIKSDKQRTTAQVVYLPESIEEQTRQAALAIERAFKDGITRQTVRLALVKKDTPISAETEEWPGGSKQMYREAGGPLTVALLEEIRAVAPSLQTEEEKISWREREYIRPNVTSQDIWDFDGTALITATAAGGPSGDVQALVFPNTDTKYLKDIHEISQNLGTERLFLLVNPFWSKVESWGFNILAPNAQKKAQETIFDCEGGGFQDTYVLSRFSARGEDCVALKVYPYDWQLYAYIEDESYGVPVLTAIRLGSSQEKPTSAQFSELLNKRDEFKLTKTMRQMNKMF